MHSLTIAFGPAGTLWRLLFKTTESAEAAKAKLGASDIATFGGTPPTFHIEDDFGQQVALKSIAEIHGYMFEDLEHSKLASIEFALHNARTQIDAQKRADSDPMIRAAALSRGPAIISQMPGNGRMG